MAEEEIEISELEFEEDLAGDLVFPVESASDTKATSLTVLKNWLKQFFVGLADNETITGLKNISNDGQASDNAQLELTATNIDASSAPASNKYAGIVLKDVNGTRIGKLEVAQYSSGIINIKIAATNNDGIHGTLAVQVAPDGTISTSAPTPASSDNTTKIATTAFVKSVLSSSGNGLATISKATNGYCKFTNGLLIQWGQTSSYTARNPTITLNQAYSSATSYAVVGSGTYSNTSSNGWNYTKSRTKTNFVAIVDTDMKPWVWLAIGY